MIVPVATFENYTGVFGDPLAESYLTAAQEKVEKYLGYTLEAADYETTTKGHGRDYVRLAAAPINSVESVTVGGVALESFRFDSKGYLYTSDGSVFVAESAVSVSYNAGYTAETLPNLIMTTILQIAALRQIESGQNIGVSSKTFGDAGTRVFLSTRKYTDFLINISSYKFV